MRNMGQIESIPHCSRHSPCAFLKEQTNSLTLYSLFPLNWWGVMWCPITWHWVRGLHGRMEKLCFPGILLFQGVSPKLEKSRAEGNIFHSSFNMVYFSAQATEAPLGASYPAQKSPAARKRGHCHVLWVFTAEDTNCGSLGSGLKTHLLTEQGCIPNKSIHKMNYLIL